MRLNIITSTPKATLDKLRLLYKENVTLGEVYRGSADFIISPPTAREERMWPIEGIIELQRYGIPLHTIRIW